MLKRLLDRVEQSLGGGEQGTKKVGTFRWLLIIGCLGVALMILSSFFSVHDDVLPQELPSGKEDETSEKAWNSKKSNTMTMKDYESMYASELSEVLGKVVGVDDVSVMVNLESSEEEVVEKDIRRNEQVTDEKDPKGGTRRIQESSKDEKVVLQRGGDGDVPIVVKKVKPKVRGVLVVAKGAENLQVKAAIIEAIQRVLDVPVHRISVLPKG
ncbi:stage III sporulation protein AG [Desmospora profundinema]|uniref:Stage III sporulation protein AG n=1 Tax=Desmospora profundinema TaxID=1571184 RepID=A0ABU1IIQ8_9BACL|nr:stage III sporulation protein AG [Desmospora profundinema]MDR6224656.1 stage III sporulation protein AG [Desmospora profundinema]